MLGYIVIALIGLNVLVNFTIVIIEGIKNLIALIRKIKAWCKLKYMQWKLKKKEK